jgi:predicted DNA-binding WGR domain protein
MMSCIVDLQAIDDDRNIARAYVIEVGQDLFGAWVLRRYWGRIGTQGQYQELIVSSKERGLKLVSQWLKDRARAPARIGLAYQAAANQTLDLCDLDRRIG